MIGRLAIKKIISAYYLDDKKVVTNRHKACEQADPSLEEFRATHTEQEVSRLIVKEHHPTYKDMNRPMPGNLFIHNGKVCVLQGNKGRHNSSIDYFVDVDGKLHRAKQCKIVKQNTGLVFV